MPSERKRHESVSAVLAAHTDVKMSLERRITVVRG